MEIHEARTCDEIWEEIKEMLRKAGLEVCGKTKGGRSRENET